MKANDDLKMAAAVFEATQEGIMTTDPDLKITAVNPAFTTITGYSERVDQAVAILDIFHQHFHANVFVTIKHMAKSIILATKRFERSAG